MKRGKREKGQAIAEFTVSLIAILFVFLGVLAISVLSMENVSCLIAARGEADVASALGTSVGGVSPEPILEWNYGSDRIPFTADDKAVTSADSENLAGEFDTSKELAEGADVNSVTLADLAKAGLVDRQATEVSFLSAANLNGYSHEETDPLSKRGLPELQKLLRRMVGGGKFVLKDTVFIPVKVD